MKVYDFRHKQDEAVSAAIDMCYSKDFWAAATMLCHAVEMECVPQWERGDAEDDYDEVSRRIELTAVAAIFDWRSEQLEPVHIGVDHAMGRAMASIIPYLLGRKS